MLHSPLLKSLKVLEKNFVHKGKKKVKRAKLYYLRDRLPVERIIPPPPQRRSALPEVNLMEWTMEKAPCIAMSIYVME
eukprot:6304080-Ditylum_brightwellii.AAC.1